MRVDLTAVRFRAARKAKRLPEHVVDLDALAEAVALATTAVPSGAT